MGVPYRQAETVGLDSFVREDWRGLRLRQLELGERRKHHRSEQGHIDAPHIARALDWVDLLAPAPPPSAHIWAAQTKHSATCAAHPR